MYHRRSGLKRIKSPLNLSWKLRSGRTAPFAHTSGPRAAQRISRRLDRRFGAPLQRRLDTRRPRSSSWGPAKVGSEPERSNILYRYPRCSGSYHYGYLTSFWGWGKKDAHDWKSALLHNCDHMFPTRSLQTPGQHLAPLWTNPAFQKPAVLAFMTVTFFCYDPFAPL